MRCPDCEARVRGNFCSQCGRQLPYLVGASYPYGLRFPSPEKNGKWHQAALERMKAAPRHSELRKGSVLYHTALYDLSSLRDLVELHGILGRFLHHDLITHTTDGGKSFFPGPMPWGCFAARTEERPATGMIYPHPGKCFSYFGCLFAQERQSAHYHADGWETFWEGIHGFFLTDQQEQFGEKWSNRLRLLLRNTPFQMQKPAIRKEVMARVKKYGGHRCPKFSSRYLDEQIAKLPDRVMPTERGWGLVESPDHWPGVYLQCYRKTAVEMDQATTRPLPGPHILIGDHHGGDCDD